MPRNGSVLFEPVSIGRLELAGRLFKTATSETRASEDGHATDKHVEFYAPMARGGTPLIITGNIYTSRDGQSSPRQMGIDSDDKVPALTTLTTALHASGAKVFAQSVNKAHEKLPPEVAATFAGGDMLIAPITLARSDDGSPCPSDADGTIEVSAPDG